MMFARSLRGRLALRLALLAVAALLLSSGFYLYSSWQFRAADIDDQLASLAARIASGARAEDGVASNRFEITPALARELRRIEGLRFAVYEVASGRLLMADPPDATRFVPQAPAAGWATAFFYTESAGGSGQAPRRFQALVTTVDSPAGPLRVVVMRPDPDAGEVLHWMLGVVTEEVLPILLPLMLAVGFVGYRELRRAFAPVQAAAEKANNVGVGASDARLPEGDLPLEILPLVQAVNRAIDRMHESFEQQRRFTANAAHEMRTPLAVLLARLDGMAPSEDLNAIRADVERMARLVGQLMAVARLDSVQGQAREPIDLVELARDTVGRMAPLALRQGVELALETPGDAVPVIGDPVSLGDSLRNLIENAIRFTPKGKTVEISVSERGEIDVADCGPGVPPADREAIFSRFWRGADRRVPGAGLGLAIVAETMAHHHGQVRVEDGPAGGARFRMVLPIQPKGDLPAAAGSS